MSDANLSYFTQHFPLKFLCKKEQKFVHRYDIRLRYNVSHNYNIHKLHGAFFIKMQVVTFERTYFIYYISLAVYIVYNYGRLWNNL